MSRSLISAQSSDPVAESAADPGVVTPRPAPDVNLRLALPATLGNILLILPAVLLGLGALLTTGPARTWLVLGWVIELIGGIWWVYGSPLADRSRFLPVGVFALVAVLWLGLTPADPVRAWFVPMALGLLLIGPSLLFAREFQARARMPELVRARRAVRRLIQRADWPEDGEQIRSLPEVRMLRESIGHDSAAAWELLTDPRLPVRLAGLAALEFRPHWHPGRAEYVSRLLQLSDNPSERAAALRALGGLDDPQLAELYRRSVRDPSWRVRHAAQEVILHKAPTQWGRYREAIHTLLTDQRFSSDPPLGAGMSHALPAAAINDLTAWAGEPGPVSLRATMALVTHYRRQLEQEPTPDLAKLMQSRLFDPRLPTIVRVELAHLLRAEGCLKPEVIQEMSSAGQPSGLRLLAAESLLRENPRHAGALAVLREVAMQPNRELAVTVAQIVQHTLHVDMGLAWNARPPAPYSREAAEVTRRVMAWARDADSTGPRRASATAWAIEVPPEDTGGDGPAQPNWDF